MKKLFIIKKWIMAENLQEAIKKEKRVAAEDVWVDDKFREELLKKEFETNDKKPIGL